MKTLKQMIFKSLILTGFTWQWPSISLDLFIPSEGKIDMNKIVEHNKKAWDLSVEAKNRWTIIASDEEIQKARDGKAEIVLSPIKVVPKEWLRKLPEKKILGLASGGGQQGPILAAAGADVTIADLSPKQLMQDRQAAEKYQLKIETVETSADDLSMFSDNSFDLVVNPCSNCFFENLEPVWKEVSRVLKTDGEIIYCFLNPISYQFDFEKKDRGEFKLKYAQPYSDSTSLSLEDQERYIGAESPLEFGHTLTDQMQLLLQQGFVIIDFYEDHFGGEDPADKFFPQMICIRAKKIK